MTKQFAAFTLILGMLLPVIGNAQGVYRGNGNDAVGAYKVYLGVKYGLVTVDPDVPGADGPPRAGHAACVRRRWSGSVSGR